MRYRIKKEHKNYFGIYKNQCQICHAKTMKSAKIRVEQIKQSGGKTR